VLSLLLTLWVKQAEEILYHYFLVYHIKGGTVYANLFQEKTLYLPGGAGSMRYHSPVWVFNRMHHGCHGGFDQSAI
jgi:hypothetical protein